MLDTSHVDQPFFASFLCGKGSLKFHLNLGQLVEGRGLRLPTILEIVNFQITLFWSFLNEMLILNYIELKIIFFIL
jgi:hypothetical protein